MDPTEGHIALAQRDDLSPEKPLEFDGNGKNGNGYRLKIAKPSKFKSIFTKSTSRQSRSSEEVAPAPVDISKSDKETIGKAENLYKLPTAQLLPENQRKSIIRDPSVFQAVPSTTTNVSRQELVQVDVHSADPPDENQTPAHKPRSLSREHKKGVTISTSQDMVSHNQFHHLSQPNRRHSKRNSGSSSCTRKGSQIEKASKLDPRTMKKKYINLLSLVDQLTDSCNWYKNALYRKESSHDAEKIRHRKDNEALNMQIFKLGQEIEAWKEECHKMENKSTALIKLKNLTQENNDLYADLEVYKSVIVQLNKELAYYQEKLRVKFKDAPENIPVYSSSTDTDDCGGGDGPTYPEDGDWLLHPRKSLLPLLIAYDEVIAEKEEILKDHEVTIDRFKGRCLEVVRENEALHQLISNSKERGSISIEEWEFLRSNAEIVLEQNDLLNEQVENLKRKEEKLFASFQVKASEFKQTVTQHEAEINRQKSVISDLEVKCKQLSDEHTSMAANVHARIPREKHEAMVQEFRRAFEELKAKYESDKKVICDTLAAAEKEKESLVEEVATLDKENTHLRRDIRDCENNLAATTEALEQMKNSLLETESAREATNGVIEDIVKHVQQLASEKNKLVEDLNQQRLLNDQMMTLRSKENELVKQLHDKIEVLQNCHQAMERLHNDEVKSLQNKVKELDEALRTKSERHRRENLQLNELLDEKDRRIDAIEESKRQLQQDLETVWRTTTTMNSSLKNRNV